MTTDQLEKLVGQLKAEIAQGRNLAPAATPQVDVDTLYEQLLAKQEAAIREREAYQSDPTAARLAKLEKTLTEISGGLAELKTTSAAAARAVEEQRVEARKREFDAQMVKVYADWNEHRDTLWAISSKHPTLTADEVYALYKATTKVAPKPQAKPVEDARRTGTERPGGHQQTVQRPCASVTAAVQEAYEEVRRNLGVPE